MEEKRVVLHAFPGSVHLTGGGVGCYVYDEQEIRNHGVPGHMRARALLFSREVYLMGWDEAKAPRAFGRGDQAVALRPRPRAFSELVVVWPLPVTET